MVIFQLLIDSRSVLWSGDSVQKHVREWISKNENSSLFNLMVSSDIEVGLIVVDL